MSKFETGDRVVTTRAIARGERDLVGIVTEIANDRGYAECRVKLEDGRHLWFNETSLDNEPSLDLSFDEAAVEDAVQGIIEALSTSPAESTNPAATNLADMPVGFPVGARVFHEVCEEYGVVIGPWDKWGGDILVKWDDGVDEPTQSRNCRVVMLSESVGIRVGMSPAQLAAEVGEFIEKAQKRVTGVGADQYDNGTEGQKFEGLPVAELFDWAEEELLDVAVYAAMLSIRIQRLKKAVEDANV